MNASRFRICRFVYLLCLAIFAAAPPAGISAQNLSPPPTGMRHKTKIELRASAQPVPDGKWDTLPFAMPINPVHVALMHTGKVLVVSGSGNDPDNKNFQAAIWNPTDLTIKTFQIPWDMFCSGMVILPDGKPFIFGGTLRYDQPDQQQNFLGEPQTATFDPVTETFAAAPGMGQWNGRWYPGGAVLGDGTVLVYSGGDNVLGNLNTSVQIWSGNAWLAAGAAFQNLRFYPRQHVLPDGRVFVSGASPNCQMYDPTTKKFAFVANTNFNLNRDYGASVLLPLTPQNGFNPSVIIMGGYNGDPNDAATDTTELIDLSVAAPKWVAGPRMNKSRVQMNATILPNGKVLASGGSKLNEETCTAVKDAQIYDPVTKSFGPAGTMEFPRVYHSNTLLLPDARVVALGGNPERKTYQPDIEIYSPSYLFAPNGQPATRPTIAGVAPGALHYGDPFSLTTPDANSIQSVVLIRPGAVTHSFDFDQRFVGLAFNVVVGGLRPRAPANGNLAPPGWYLLFIVNKDGVPSVGKFVHLS